MWGLPLSFLAVFLFRLREELGYRRRILIRFALNAVRDLYDWLRLAPCIVGRLASGVVRGRRGGW